jgi:hypothetical protein
LIFIYPSTIKKLKNLSSLQSLVDRYCCFDSFLIFVHVSDTDLRSVRKWFFWTPIWAIRHVLQKCHTSAGHQHVSDTVTRQIIELSVLHNSLHYFHFLFIIWSKHFCHFFFLPFFVLSFLCWFLVYLNNKFFLDK